MNDQYLLYDCNENIIEKLRKKNDQLKINLYYQYSIKNNNIEYTNINYPIKFNSIKFNHLEIVKLWNYGIKH